ncbi:uncharacterized protein NDAI_0C00150 [Naumovozyma dairenensis CBS 421]|uniref:Uncharacterized protein n=1 Tax=Naumovozyma dairenensis (strain ATCC 10597 / BCRC 20456 / CBS 421 / NBRC 0211 / NRRL Y-12639) TaxID=1071378 RepID=G0W7B5_NAUDC|nr:hypothetical protein NDAI_0C00150 [Naumovozyma dairenensis CBS 421]CCD23676.1 hypothetical protein NDAI_0C00150 [Naumovozyma dairenensis CBS 421]
MNEGDILHFLLQNDEESTARGEEKNISDNQWLQPETHVVKVKETQDLISKKVNDDRWPVPTHPDSSEDDFTDDLDDLLFMPTKGKNAIVFKPFRMKLGELDKEASVQGEVRNKKSSNRKKAKAETVSKSQVEHDFPRDKLQNADSKRKGSRRKETSVISAKKERTKEIVPKSAEDNSREENVQTDKKSMSRMKLKPNPANSKSTTKPFKESHLKSLNEKLENRRKKNKNWKRNIVSDDVYEPLEPIAFKTRSGEIINAEKIEFIDVTNNKTVQKPESKNRRKEDIKLDKNEGDVKENKKSIRKKKSKRDQGPKTTNTNADTDTNTTSKNAEGHIFDTITQKSSVISTSVTATEVTLESDPRPSQVKDDTQPTKNKNRNRNRNKKGKSKPVDDGNVKEEKKVLDQQDSSSVNDSNPRKENLIKARKGERKRNSRKKSHLTEK